MATIANQQQDEGSNLNVFDPQQELQQQQQQGQGTQPQQVTEGVQSTSPSQPQTAQTPNPRARSGSFSNLQQFIKANRPQAGRLAQAVGKDVQRRSQQIGQQLTQSQQDFQRRIAENRARQQSAQQFAQQQLQEAGTGEVPTQEEAQRFQSLLRGQVAFDQPGQLNIAAQQIAARRLQEQAQNVGTTQGRGNLIQQALGGTRGQRTLDELILQASPEATQQLIQQTRGSAEQLGQQVQQVGTEAARNVDELVRQQRAFQQGLQEQVTGQREGLKSELQQRLESADQSLINRLREGIATGRLTQDELTALGIEGNRLYNVNAQELLATPEATLSNIARQEDLARAQALSNLSGLEQDIILDPTQVGQYQVQEEERLNALRQAVAEQAQAFQAKRGNLERDLIEATQLGLGTRSAQEEFIRGYGDLTAAQALEQLQGRPGIDRLTQERAQQLKDILLGEAGQALPSELIALNRPDVRGGQLLIDPTTGGVVGSASSTLSRLGYAQADRARQALQPLIEAGFISPEQIQNESGLATEFVKFARQRRALQELQSRIAQLEQESGYRNVLQAYNPENEAAQAEAARQEAIARLRGQV